MGAAAAIDRAVAIAIVEDDPLLREHLAALVANVQGFALVGAVGTLNQGRKFLAGNVDVLLVDLALPDGSGLDLIRQARAGAHPALRIIVISVFGDVANVVRAIEAGADGYLLKGADTDQAERAIRTVISGGAPVSPSVASHILARLRTQPCQPGAALPGAQSLTDRERNVLGDLAKGFSYKEVAKRQGISHHTVADHVKAIYRKLSVNSRSRAVFEAMQSGLIDMNE